MSLKDKVAIISGSTGALGMTVTKTFLTAGAKVVALYSRESSLETLQSKMALSSESFFPVRTNVLDEASIKEMVKEVLENYGRIDILINLVGGFFGGVSIVETTDEQWDKMINLNLKSVFLCCRNIFPAMKSGRIITIGGKGGLKATSGMSAYSASKAGLINFTEALAEEGRDHNITANVVIPSIIDTADNRKAMPNANFDNWVKPEMIAETILFLCSEAAAEINGAVIPVYGKS